MTHDFFQKDTPHGLVKRIMYKKYLQAFIPITQQAKIRRSLKTVIIDGFAGAGRYGEEWPDSIESYGSPLIALMVSLNYFFRKQHKKDKTWGKQPTARDTDAEIVDLVATMTLSDDESGAQLPVQSSIYLYFIEADAENFNSLRENIAEVLEDFFPNPDASYIEKKCKIRTDNGEKVELYEFIITHPYYPIVCNLVNAEFRKVVPPPEIEDDNAKCLVFLDPFGYSQTPMLHVKKYSGPGNSLFINFMSSYVNRFHSTNVEAIENLFGIDYLYGELANGHPFQESLSQSLVKFSSYLFNLSQFLDQPLNDTESCTAVYETALKKVCKTDFSLTFEMRRKNNSIVYHLIFITDHMKSLEIMKESMNRCSQAENGFSMSDFMFIRNGCQLNLANTQDVSLLADDIYKKFGGCSKVKISQIKDYVLLDTPYVFRKRPLAVMVKEENPRVTQVVDTDGVPPIRKGTFPDKTDWVLTFRLNEETKFLAEKLFTYYDTKDVERVSLSAIKCEFFLNPAHKCLISFLHNALYLLASQGNVAVYYADEEGSTPTFREIFNHTREWYIVFRQSLPYTTPILMHDTQTMAVVCVPMYTGQTVTVPFKDSLIIGGIYYKRVIIF